jgi:hypothetical protein
MVFSSEVNTGSHESKAEMLLQAAEEVPSGME